jgi:hypothetical protein
MRWETIKDFNEYEVSTTGLVRSKSTNKLLTPSKLRNGYMNIKLYQNFKQKNLLLHRVIAIAFIPNPDNRKTVNHKDSNRANNSLDNLEWSTQSANVIHGYTDGLHNTKGVKNGNSKLTAEQVLKIREDQRSYPEIAIDYSIAPTTVGNIKNRYIWKHI